MSFLPSPAVEPMSVPLRSNREKGVLLRLNYIAKGSMVAENDVGMVYLFDAVFRNAQVRNHRKLQAEEVAKA